MSAVGRLLVVGVLAAVFTLLTLHASTDFALEADQDALRSVHEPELREESRFVSAVGGGWGVSVFGLCVVALLLHRNRRFDAAVFAIATAGGAWNPLLKVIVDRPRPVLWEDADRLSTPSFPSGHAASSAALAVALIALMWNTRWRVPVTVASATAAVLVAMSRLQLGVHYPSDVVAAWIYVTCWVIGVHLVAARVRERRSAAAEFDDADVGARGDPDRRAPVAEPSGHVQPGSVDPM